MAFEKIRPYQYICDTKNDLENIPERKMGVECFVIKEACEYKLMSTGEWVRQVLTNTGTNGNIDLSNYVLKEDLKQEISKLDINLTNEEIENIIASIDKKNG